MFVGAGVIFAVPDFDVVQDHDGDLRPMADQVERAIQWIYAHAAEIGGDPNRITLSAHSSGAHLAAVALTRLSAGPDALPPGAIKSALLASGLYDLAPVRLSARSSYVAITDDIERSLSPIRHVASITTPVIVADASLDSPEFQRQSQDFADALAARRLLAGRLHGEGYNHFELLETLANPYGLLGRAALARIAANTFPQARGLVPDRA
jgi:arylformamidase